MAARRKQLAPTPADEVEAITLSTLREIAGSEDLSRPDLALNPEPRSPPPVPPNRPPEREEPLSSKTVTSIPEAETPKSITSTDASVETAPKPNTAESVPEVPVDVVAEAAAEVDAFMQEESQDAPATPVEVLSKQEVESSKDDVVPVPNLVPEVTAAIEATPAAIEATPADVEVVETPETVEEESDEEDASVATEGGFVAVARSSEVLPPGSFKVRQVKQSSFEVRWEVPISDHRGSSCRLTLFDANRHVLEVIITEEKSWTFIGLEPGKRYGAAVTARTELWTNEGQPSERMAEFLIPKTTMMTETTLKPYDTELAYWFDGQKTSYFASRPFKLYLGTVQPDDGTFSRETKVSLLEALVRGGLRGSSASPGLAYTGVTALENYAPYGLGSGVYVDFEVAEGHKSIYELELKIFQMRPRHEDYAQTAPDTVKELMSRVRKEQHRLWDEKQNNKQQADAPLDTLESKQAGMPLESLEGNQALELASQREKEAAEGALATELAPAPVEELPPSSSSLVEQRALPTQYDEELVGGGTYLHVRTRDHGEWVTSDPVTKLGEWVSLKVRTKFISNKIRLHVQVPAKSFCSVLIDNFKVSYIGPSELELMLRKVRTEVRKAADRGTAEGLTLSLICAEDLLTSSGAPFTGAVLCKLDWRGKFLAQTSVRMGSKGDPSFHATFKLPLLKKGAAALDVGGLRIRVLDAVSLSLIGEMNLSAQAIQDHTASPCLHMIARRLPKGNCCKRYCCCSACCFSRSEKTSPEVVEKKDSNPRKPPLSSPGDAPSKELMDRLEEGTLEEEGGGDGTDEVAAEVAISEEVKQDEVKKIEEEEDDTKSKKKPSPRGRLLIAVSRVDDYFEEEELQTNQSETAGTGPGAHVQSPDEKGPPKGEKPKAVKAKDSPKKDSKAKDKPKGKGKDKDARKGSDKNAPTGGSDDAETLIQLRKEVLKRDRKASRAMLRVFRQPRNECDTLMFKSRCLELGCVEAALVVLSDEDVGSYAAECLSEFMTISEEVLETHGGLQLRKKVRAIVHDQGAAKACFQLARARARQVGYYADNLKRPLLPPEHLVLLSDLYVTNRGLLLEAICEETCFLELIVRCLPSDEPDAHRNKGAPQAAKLLEEVGLGLTLPEPVLNEYGRLRRIVPLDERYWKCEALSALSGAALPPRITHIFEPDRVACLPPEIPDMTFCERLIWRIKQCFSAVFNCTALSALAMSLFAITRNSMKCPLTLAILILASATLCSVCAGRCISKMNKIGMGSQMALLCCPIVTCNALGLFFSMGWSYFLFFTAEDDVVEVCKAMGSLVFAPAFGLRTPEVFFLYLMNIYVNAKPL